MNIIIFFSLTKFIKYKYHKSLNIYYLIPFIFIDFYIIYSKQYNLLILFYILMIQTIFDLINNDIYTILNLFIIINSFIFKQFDLFNTLNNLILILILLIIYYFRHSIGLGDIELLFSLSFIYDLYNLSLILLISSLFALLYSSINKKRYYAFVPFISLAIYILELLNFI